MAFAQNLAASPPTTASGSNITTDANGALTGLFSDISAEPAGSYSTSGITLQAPVTWHANNFNGVLYDTLSPSVQRGLDAAGPGGGGIRMNVANWTAPQPYSDDCPAASSPAAVPTLGQAGLALLSVLLAGLGLAHRRRG